MDQRAINRGTSEFIKDLRGREHQVRKWNGRTYTYTRLGRTYYDANMVAAPVRNIPPEDASIDDQTHWARFIEPRPMHILKYEGPLNFMIAPWFNI